MVYDFPRVSLLEAYKSICKYDLIAITETHLDTKVTEEIKLCIDGYTFLENDRALDTKQGGGCNLCKRLSSSCKVPRVGDCH